MKVWITAKNRAKGSACVYGLTEENQHIRLLRPNGLSPRADTHFAVGQVWDLTFHAAPDLLPPHSEDVIVTRWHQLAPEPDLREVLRERVTPWVGGPDQLFGGKLRSVIGAHNIFLSERDTFPAISMGYCCLMRLSLNGTALRIDCAIAITRQRKRSSSIIWAMNNRFLKFLRKPWSMWLCTVGGFLLTTWLWRKARG